MPETRRGAAPKDADLCQQVTLPPRGQGDAERRGNEPHPKACSEEKPMEKAPDFYKSRAFRFGGLGPYRKTRCKPRRHWVSGFFENSGYKPGYNRSIVVFLRFFGLEPLTHSSRIESTKTVVLDILVRRVTNHERIKRRVM